MAVGRGSVLAHDLLIALTCILLREAVTPLQVTVNNQIVVGTLMNLCDDPNRVSVYQVWRDSDFVQRVPIIVTGNDLSHMFAPLIRDGRMSKFYWKPDRVDLSNILHQMYKVCTIMCPCRIICCKGSWSDFVVQVVAGPHQCTLSKQQIDCFRISIAAVY